jgi:hypothetical protein
MCLNSLKSRICGLVVGLGLLSSMASAATIVVDPVVSGSGPWTFTYSVTLFDSDLQADDFFVIYDFRQYVGGTIFAPANWAASVQNLGLIPYNQTPTDNAAVANLVFTYKGATLTTGPLGVLPLGNFGAQSIAGGQLDANGTYAAEDTKLGTAGPNAIDQGNIGHVAIPIPLPAAAWAGMALLGVLGAARIRKQIAA